jgi:tetratricopeptide (TPR) repeat protein
LHQEISVLRLPYKTFLTPFLMVGLVWAQSQAGKRESIDAIRSALQSGRAADALRLAREAIAALSDDPRLDTLEAIAYLQLHQETSALAEFQKALNLSPNYLPALEGAAQLEYKAGNANAAIPLLDRILQAKPDEQTALAMRGMFAARQNDCARAVEDFSKSMVTIGSQPAALAQCGVCLAKLNRLADAATVFGQLAAVQPADPRAKYALASVKVMAHRYQDAIEILEPLISGSVLDPRALEIAASAYEGLGDTPRAVKTLRHAILLQPRDASLYVDFADLCFTHKSFQVGIDMIDAGLSQLPNAAPLYLARGVLHVQLGNFDRADSDFARAEFLDPKQAGAFVAGALALYQEDRFDEAMAAAESQLRSHPEDAFLLYLKAEILARTNDNPGTSRFREALSAANRAVQFRPDLVIARDLLSRLLLESGQTDAAIEQTRLALKYDPSDEVAMYRLIRALRAKGSGSQSKEVARVMSQLAAAQESARKREAQESRYRLVEETGPSEDSTAQRDRTLR